MKNLRLMVVVVAVCATMHAGAAAAEEIEPACTETQSAEKIVQNLDADIVNIRDERKRHESELEAQIHAAASGLIETGKWSEKDRAKFFAKLQKSGEFQAIEKEKRSALALFGLAAQTFVARKGQEPVHLVCNSAEDMKSMLRKVGVANDKQYAIMLSKIQAIAAK